MLEIKQAFETKISTINPTIATVYEGNNYTPVINVPYQELYLLPAGNDDPYINDKEYVSYGIFQITLKYPTGTNASKLINERCKLYLDNFERGTNLIQNSIRVKVKNTPIVRNLGIVGDRLIYAISINYEAFYRV